MKYRAVIFDYDYTLVNSEAGIVKCYHLVLADHGVTDVSDFQIKRTIGLTLEKSFARLMGTVDVDTLTQLRKEYVLYADKHMVSNTKLYPATVDTFVYLNRTGRKIGICSNKYAYRIRATLENENLTPYIDALLGGSDVEHAKPNPEGLNRMAREFGIDKTNILYVGDSTVDALTASEAGIDFVGVLSGMTTREEFLPYASIGILDELSQLKVLLQGMDLNDAR